MTAPATTPLSYNLYIQQIGVLAVANTSETAGVWSFNDAPLQTLLPQMLNYAELRIQRDVDFLNAKAPNNYTLTAGVNVLSIPINDFLMIETLELLQIASGTVYNSSPLTPVSPEFIQNCYSGLAQAGCPRFFAMVGDNFGDGGNSNINVLLGPAPNYGYTVRVRGFIRLPSLAQFDTAGPADSSFTYISEFMPDLLLMASMIYISAFQRNWSAGSDDPGMGVNYEKQYQALLVGARSEENRRKFQASAWTAYSSPPAATPTR
jgi:hypothetical protein